MQPKFTLRDLGYSGIKIFALALILALSAQFSYSQEPTQSRQPSKAKADIQAKLKLKSRTASSSRTNNDAGAPDIINLANRTQAICTTFTGTFVAGDPTFNSGRLFRDGIASTCAVPKACPGNTAAGSVFRYRTHTFTETSGSAQCVTVTHTNTGAAGAPHMSIHSGAFDPANICTGYIADEGGSPNPTFNVVSSFTIPANATVTLVLTETAVGAGGTYSITMDMPICAPLPPCTGTPAPGNTLSTANPVCPSVNFTLSLQNNPVVSGLSWQWQSSPDNVTWTNIAGATSASLVRNQTVATWYRAQVTCSGNTGTSTPLRVTMNPPSACYCLPPPSDCTDNDVITRVRISTLDNASACDAGPPAGYGNYTSLPATTVYSGAANQIRVDVPLVWPETVGVWIDYNQNGQFEASEFTFVGNNNAGGTVTNNINIPTSALTGNTRMRVRVEFFTNIGPNDACIGFVFGETEDYTVNIQPCVPVTISGSPANTSIACGSNASFTVTTNGSLPAYAWEYRVNASSPWQNVTSGGIFSNVNSATLTLTNVSQAFNGYQFRALVSGGCSAVDFSAPATLTVTALIPVVTPPSATICTGSIQSLSLTNTLGNSNLINEGFSTVSPLPAGWFAQNNSTPIGVTGWFQGNAGVFPANNGAPDSYIGANFNNVSGANTISNWLLTPNVNMKNGDIFTFYTRTISAPAFPDRLEVRLSTNGASTSVGATNASVGDFTTLLLTINPSLTTAGYPTSWTQFTVTLSGLSGTVSGRFAFRYFVTNGGPAGANSDYIGIDDVVFTSTGGIAQGIWTGPAGTMFTNAGATVPYTGTPATTIYVNPTVTSNYSVSFTTLTPCTSATTVVPVTVVNPVSAVVNPVNKSACVGGGTSFTVSAAGGPVTYQWQVSTDGGVTWTNIAGATAATLNLTGITQLMNNNRYRAVLTAAPCAGSTTTTAATLTVNALPVVTISASDPTLAPGQTSVITASSTPAAAPNGWAWTLNGSPIPGTTNTQTVTIDDLGTYQATVTDVNGCVSSSNSVVVGAESSDRLWIYPNPTTGLFQVRLYYDSDVAEKRTVTIYNQLGQVITSKYFDLVSNTAPYLQMNFDLSHVPRGIYAVKVAHQFTGKVVSGLVIVE